MTSSLTRSNGASIVGPVIDVIKHDAPVDGLPEKETTVIECC